MSETDVNQTDVNQTDVNQTTADALVLFGLTGDLGEKKLFPAIVELASAGLLQGPVIGVGRSERSDDDLWQMLIDATGDEGRALQGRLDLGYLAGDSADEATYRNLADRLGDVNCPVIYAALPPDLFAGVATGLEGAGLADRARLVVEKPFGRDAASARELFERLSESIDPDRIFAVDHFLAKSSVENLLAFRSANPMIEAALRRGVAQRVELTMAESFGVDGRGSFYDGVGAIRDVVQNHLLQTLAVLLMEPPADGSAQAAAEARSALLSAVRPIDPARAVRGQFEGYRDIDGVDDESQIETYLAAELAIDCDRWRDVPVLLRTGKELARSYTEAVITFADEPNPSRLRLGLKPDPTIVLELAVLDTEHHEPGSGAESVGSADEPDGHGLRDVVLWACGPSDHGELGDYATMLAGALTGDHQHFARIDDIEAAWRVVEPLLDPEHPPEPYDKGTMGPSSADDLTGCGHWVDGPLDARC